MRSVSSPAPAGNDLLLSQGYGYIPRAVMTDRRLTMGAKALYAYLCSFSGSQGVAWPSVDRICSDLGMGAAAFRTALSGLVEPGYVTVERVREQGRFARSVYMLGGAAINAPSMNVPPVDEPPMEEPQSDSPPAAEPRADGRTTINNRLINNTPINTGDDGGSVSLTRSHARGSDVECFEKLVLNNGPLTCAHARCRNAAGMPDNARKELERRRIASMAAELYPDMPQESRVRRAGREEVRRGFARCCSREALEAEVDMLAELLDRCDAGALLRLIRISAEHAAGSPAPYVRKMAQRYRSDALAYGILTRPFEKITEEVLDAVDLRNEPP